MKKMVISILISAVLVLVALTLLAGTAFAQVTYGVEDIYNAKQAPSQPEFAEQEPSQPEFFDYVPFKIDFDDTVPNEFFQEPVKGSKFATVKMVVYHDFQGPFDKRYWDNVVSKIHDFFSEDEVSITIVNFPLVFHPNAFEAAKAGECANLLSNNFFDYADLMFENQFNLSRTALLDYAEKVGINRTAFEVCMDNNPQINEEVQSDIEFATKLDIRGVPTTFINYKKIRGAQPFETFKKAIENELNSATSQPIEFPVRSYPSKREIVIPTSSSPGGIKSITPIEVTLPSPKSPTLIPSKPEQFVVVNPIPVEFSPEFFKLSIGDSKELKFGKTKLLLSLKEITNEQIQKCVGKKFVLWGSKDELECFEVSQLGAKITINSNSGNFGWTYFLGPGEKIRVEGISIQLNEISDRIAVFMAESQEYVKLPTQLPSRNFTISADSVIGSSIFEQKPTQLMPVNIGTGPIKVSIFPVKTLEIIDEKVTETFEISRDIGTAANTARSIRSISIKPNLQKIHAEIETDKGTVLQEISSEFRPIVNYKEVFIEQDFLNKKIILTQNDSVVETRQEIEVNGDLFVKSENTKKKLTILPTRALQLIKEKAKIVPQKTVLKIENQKAVYSASETREGKILGILPIKFAVEAKVDAQSGEVKVNQPFWSVLVTK